MFEHVIKSQHLPDFLWSEEEYESLGVRIELKVRRQVDRGGKLLCNCPVMPPDSDYDVEVSRHLRPAAYHGAEPASMPMAETRCFREVIYRLTRKSSCTYEMDDSPPVRINRDALAATITVARSMGCILPEQSQIMRERFLDGSIPSGFQRSMLIGWNCSLPFLKKLLNIQRVTLTEDSARLVEDSMTRRVFMTDRLGVPVLVITTAPELRNPAQAAAAATLLRMVTSRTPGAMHRQSALRFDLGIGIRGAGFVEVRGLDSINTLVRVAHYEVLRQKRMLDLSAEVNRRGIDMQRFASQDVTRWFKSLKKTPQDVVYAVLLPGFRGLMRQAMGPNRELLDEFVDRVHRIACLPQNMVLCSEGPEDFVLSEVFAKADRLMQSRRSDVIFLLVGPEESVKWGVTALTEQARVLTDGGSPEVRRPLRNGETTFLMPDTDSSLRLPETDMPAVPLHSDLNTIDMPWQIARDMQAQGLSAQQIHALIAKRAEHVFNRMCNLGYQPTLAAQLTLQFWKPELETALIEAAKEALNTYSEPLQQKAFIKGRLKHG